MAWGSTKPKEGQDIKVFAFVGWDAIEVRLSCRSLLITSARTYGATR